MKKGLYLALITALISGFSVFINKFAVDAIKSPLVFTSVKNLAVGLLLVSIVVFSGKWKHLKLISKKNYLLLIAIGIVGGAIPFYLFFTGLSMTTAVNGALIQKTLVFWVALFAIPLLKDRLTKKQTLAVLTLFASNFFIGGFTGFKFSLGEAMILAATVLWGFEHVLAKKVLVDVDPDIVTASRMGIGSILLISASVGTGAISQVNFTPTNAFWLGITILSLFAYVSFWYRALKADSAIKVSAVLVSATLVTNILTAMFVTHMWNLTFSLQSILIIVGLLTLVSFYREGHPNIKAVESIKYQ